MNWRWLSSVACLTWILGSAAGGYAAYPCAQPCGSPACGPYSDACGAGALPVQYVQKTVLVPQWTTESRRITVTQYRTEMRPRTFTVHRMVTEPKTVTEEVTVMVPQPRTREVRCTVRVPVTRQVQQEFQVRVPRWREVQRTIQVQVPTRKLVTEQYTVLVPHSEVRQGTRHVWRMTPVTEHCTVVRDQGGFEERLTQVYGYRGPGCGGCSPYGCSPYAYSPGCGGCQGCGPQLVTRQVWVPKLVQEVVPVTVHRPQLVEEPYQFTVQVCRPVVRTRQVERCDYVLQSRQITERVCEMVVERQTRTVNVCSYELREQTRTETYTEWEPRKQQRTYTTVVCRPVVEERTENCLVQVPEQVERVIQVPVCRMVAHTVQVPVTPVCASLSYGCAPRGAIRGRCVRGGCW